MRRRIALAIDRLGWGVADQALSSLTNILLAIWIARMLGTGDFGAFALTFATYVLAQGLARAVAAEPMMVRYSASTRSEWHNATSASSAAVLLLGAFLALLCAATAFIATGPFASAMASLAPFLPALLLQDHLRFAFFARGTGHNAFVNDLTWTALIVIALASFTLTGRISVSWYVIAWASSGSVAAALGILQVGWLRRPWAPVTWCRQQRDLIPRYLAEFGAGSGTWEVTLYGVGAVGGLTVVGALRAADVLMGPVRVLSTGIYLNLIPESVRALHSGSPQNILRVGRALSIFLGAAALVWGSILILLPDSAGSLLLQDTWDSARPVIMPMMWVMAARGVLSGAFVGLRALGDARRSLRARLVLSPLVLVGGIGGAALGGALGAAHGLIVAYALGSAFWWRQFDVGLRSYVSAGQSGQQAPGS